MFDCQTKSSIKRFLGFEQDYSQLRVKVFWSIVFKVPQAIFYASRNYLKLIIVKFCLSYSQARFNRCRQREM